MNFIAILFSLLGISLYAAMAVSLYSWLPGSLGAFGSRHGRYADLGVDQRQGGTPPGKVTANGIRGLGVQAA